MLEGLGRLLGFDADDGLEVEERPMRAEGGFEQVVEARQRPVLVDQETALDLDTPDVGARSRGRVFLEGFLGTRPSVVRYELHRVQVIAFEVLQVGAGHQRQTSVQEPALDAGLVAPQLLGWECRVDEAVRRVFVEVENAGLVEPPARKPVENRK